jgi:N-acetylmuramoyl-L-alanine amidase
MLVLVILAVALTLPSTAEASNVRLFIDPGHGGKDPGAAAGGFAEKNSNLQIGMLVFAAARRQGWTVTMSRSRDFFVPLEVRSRRAARWKATDFVSVHSNSSGPRAKGNMTIYRTPAGARLGAHIMAEIAQLTPYGDVGNKRDVRGLAVLRGATKPAVIVEILSVSSPQERTELRDTAVQAQYAEAIVRGIASEHGVQYTPPAPPAPLPGAQTAPMPPPVAGPATTAVSGAAGSTPTVPQAAPEHAAGDTRLDQPPSATDGAVPSGDGAKWLLGLVGLISG